MKITAFVGTMVWPLRWLWPSGARQALAGEPSAADYRVLAPIRHGNLTVFPVVAAASHDTGRIPDAG